MLILLGHGYNIHVRVVKVNRAVDLNQGNIVSDEITIDIKVGMLEGTKE